MTMHRVKFGAAIAAALLALAPSAATAQSGIQDVINHGRVNGVEIPESSVEWMRRQGPDAFEFRGVWLRRAERMIANRRALEAARRMAPARGGAAQITTTSDLQAAGAVLDGTFRMPMLLGLPSDVAVPHAQADYQNRMFGTATSAYSLTTLYAEMSQGLFNFTGDVIGWAAIANTAVTYYGTGNSGNQIFGDTFLFMQHTVAAADATTDFGQYDNDGPDGVPNSGDDDGFVDLTGFMYPAHGRECGGPGIWAHRWVTNGWTGTLISTNDPSAEGGNIRLRDYIIQGGLDCNGSSLQQIGVVAHEAGHGFGLPDLYDTDPSDGSDGQGIGEWGLMGSGNWNEPNSPAHLEAWSKMFLGWVDVVTLQRDTALTMQPVITNPTVYRINIANAPQEYFLLENRQRLGSDVNLNGTGLLIWHIDSVRIAQRSNSNSVNAIAAHKGVDLEEADGLNQLDTPNNRGDAGDSWPGSLNRRTFSATSTPNSNTYNAGTSFVELTNITEVTGGNVTLNVNIPNLFTYGDVNNDSAVNLDDLDIVSAFAIGATGPDFSRIMRADVDNDGDVDARDAFIIHAYADGEPTTSFRVGQTGSE